MAKKATSSKTKECPFCGETIKTVAKKCKHCGEWLDGHSRASALGVDVDGDVDGDVSVAGRDVVKASLGKLETCEYCDGEGVYDCDQCGGSGLYMLPPETTGEYLLSPLSGAFMAGRLVKELLSSGDMDSAMETAGSCTNCEGEGELVCPECKGKGKVRV